MEELKCPRCGCTEIEVDHCVKTDYIDKNTMVNLYYGWCIKCHSLFKWEEIFIFNRYQNVKTF